MGRFITLPTFPSDTPNFPDPYSQVGSNERKLVKRVRVVLDYAADLSDMETSALINAQETFLGLPMGTFKRSVFNSDLNGFIQSDKYQQTNHHINDETSRKHSLQPHTFVWMF